MKYLNTYKLFESTEEISNQDIAELIEECKDIVETFNESEDAYKVANYQNGFVNKDVYNDGSVRIGNFTSNQSHESDMAAIKFYLGLSSDLSGNYFKEYEENITPEKIDNLIELLNKSKNLVQRLSRYCDKIYYKLDGKSIRFILIFKNPDETGSKKAKIQRIFDKINNKLNTRNSWEAAKVFQIVQLSGDDRVSDKYKDFYNLIKNNPNLIDGRYGKWDESRRSNLEVRFSSSLSLEGDTITITVTGFKYKTYMMDRLKAIRLNNDEKSEMMKLISNRMSNILRNDIDSLDITIEGNQIKIKVK